MVEEFQRQMDPTGIRVALALDAVGGQREYLDETALSMVSEDEVESAIEAILSYSGQDDMPPDPKHLRWLVDAIAHFHGAESRSAGWSVIGLNPKDGRGYLGRNNERTPWHVFYTARAYGLGLSKDQSESV